MVHEAFPASFFLVFWGIYLQTTVMLTRLILQIAQPYCHTPFCYQQQIIILLVLVGYVHAQVKFIAQLFGVAASSTKRPSSM